MENEVKKAKRLTQRRASKIKKSKLRCALQGAERHAKSLAGPADAEYRGCSCCGAQREAESLACKYNLGGKPRALTK